MSAFKIFGVTKYKNDFKLILFKFGAEIKQFY